MILPVNSVAVLVDSYLGISVLISPVRLYGDSGRETVLVIQDRCAVLIHVMRVCDFSVLINGKFNVLAVSVAIRSFLLMVAVRGAAG